MGRCLRRPGRRHSDPRSSAASLAVVTIRGDSCRLKEKRRAGLLQKTGTASETRPVDLRGRAYVGFASGGFDTTFNVNYVDDYANPFAIGGARTVDSWTTVDWSSSFTFDHADTWLAGVRISLSMQNLLDKDPPFVGASGRTGPALQIPVGFDPANANPLGRFVSAGIAIKW